MGSNISNAIGLFYGIPYYYQEVQNFKYLTNNGIYSSNSNGWCNMGSNISKYRKFLFSNIIRKCNSDAGSGNGIY